MYLTFLKLQQKRRIDLITIGNFNFKNENQMSEEHQKGKTDQKKKVVLIIARAHGGEPPASFICQGITIFFNTC